MRNETAVNHHVILSLMHFTMRNKPIWCKKQNKTKNTHPKPKKKNTNQIKTPLSFSPVNEF